MSNRGRYSMSNINQQLTINVKKLVHASFFSNVVNKFGAFIVYSLSFNLADLIWPEEQSTSFRYVW